MVQIWHAGLRGAIAYTLSMGFPTQHQDVVYNATSTVIVFTIVVNGGTTGSFLKWLKIKRAAPTSIDVQRRVTHEEQKSSTVKRCLASIDR